jgi:AcrR family transcriptional regulator
MTSSMGGPPSLAERKRQLVRDELAEVAMKLFAARGFDATTIEAITEAAGVSRRTFFRYFEAKEDVIIEFLDELGVRLCADLAARPQDEPPGVAIRGGMDVFLDAFREHPEKSLVLARMTLETPPLRARYLDRLDGWRACLTTELAARARVDPADDMGPALAAAVALAAFDTAMIRWIRDGGGDLGELVDQAFARCADALR